MPDELDPSLERDRQLFYELEEIEKTLLRRKTQSGISYYIPNKKQLQFHQSTAVNIMYLGANRCLGGETLIYDPVRKEHRRVDEVKEDFHVLAWDGERLVAAKAGKPCTKGIDNIYEITLSSGEKFSCSMSHRVLTSSGYAPVSSLQVGCAVFHPPSISGIFQEVPLPSGRYSFQKVQDSQCDYQFYPYSYDERPLSFLGNDQDVSPLQGGVHERMTCGRFQQTGVQDDRRAYSHPYRDDGRLPSSDALPRFEGQFVGTLYCASCTIFQQYPHEYCIACQSMLASYLPQSNCEPSQRRNQSYSTMPCSIPSYSVIISIVYKRRDVKWDFHVPIYNNYYAGGTIHHNSGKTTAACADYVMHSTGVYPDWYPEDKKIHHPVKLLFIALSFEALKKYIEPKFDLLMPKYNIKSVHRSSDGHITQYRITHKSGGVSQIDMASQEQDPMTFEGADYDMACSDEPLKRYIFVAVSRGLVDRGGRFLFAMTPLIQPWMKDELCDKADGKFCEVIHCVMNDNLEDIKGNPILNTEYIQRFADILNEDEKEMRLYGRWFHMSGIVYKEFDQSVHVIEDVKVDRIYPVYFVLDPHDRNPHWGIWAYVDKTDDVIICDELIQHGTPEEYSKAVLSLEKDRNYRIRKRIIDPNFGNKPQAVGSRVRVIDQFRNSGLKNMVLGIDDDEAGKLRIRSYLKFNRTKKVDISNKPKLYFFKTRAIKTWKAMSNLQYQDWQRKVAEDKERKESVKDKDKHASDTVRYLLLSNPKYERPAQAEDVDKPIY